MNNVIPIDRKRRPNRHKFERAARNMLVIAINEGIARGALSDHIDVMNELFKKQSGPDGILRYHFDHYGIDFHAQVALPSGDARKQPLRINAVIESPMGRSFACSKLRFHGNHVPRVRLDWLFAHAVKYDVLDAMTLVDEKPRGWLVVDTPAKESA